MNNYKQTRNELIQYTDTVQVRITVRKMNRSTNIRTINKPQIYKKPSQHTYNSLLHIKK